uniref:RRM domain-containing protein n=1 Tax=Chlamydomonas euryale TaxID=1486919 RepID=A0A6U2I6J2_9CHLO|mmetsp:Transcript_41864/g.125281  ORF Transcript_41864/g.125281 Transcript_41864/m.125281 type:complete len:100 (+) Transcript_41864:2128-2427(+)
MQACWHACWRACRHACICTSTYVYQQKSACHSPEPHVIAVVQAIKVLNMIKMFGKPIRVNKAASDKKASEVGANLFVGNLDVDVDEKVRRQSERKFWGS